ARPEPAHEGVHQRLRRARLLRNEGPRRIKHGGGIGTAEHVAGARRRARIRHHLDQALALEQVDDRIDVDDGVDLAALDRGDGARARADADERRVVAPKPVLHHQMLHHEIRARARRAHTDLHALEVGRRAVALHFCTQYAEHVARKLTATATIGWPFACIWIVWS